MASKSKDTSGAPVTRERRWMRPSKRAKGYAAERKSKVHQRGKNAGMELDDYNKGLRSGYLLCQSDHAGSYKYDEAIKAGKTKKEAAAYSRTIGKGGNKE